MISDEESMRGLPVRPGAPRLTKGWNMAYVKRKRINGHDYYYLVESYRAGGKVKTRTLKYLGRKPDVPEDLACRTTRVTRRRRQKTLWDIAGDP